MNTEVSPSSPAESVANSNSGSTGAANTEAPAPVSSKANLFVSPAAVNAIRKQIQKRGRPDTALRVGIRGGGCSGFSYVIEFHEGPPRPKDIVLDHGDVRVVVDPKSLLYLNGSTLDWEQTLLKQGFKFLNPNETSNCGCGHSFTV